MVNVAARLEQAAAAGAILVGERTVAVARGAFEFEQPTAIDAKGKSGGVVAQRLVRALSLMRPRGVSGLARAFVGREQEVERLCRAYRATEFAIRRYELDDALALLQQALSLQPDEEAQARVWRTIGKANALKFDGAAFLTAMQNSLKVCSNKDTCADTYSELAFQTAIRSSMWAKRPDRELVRGWIEQALELSEPESDSRAKALIARSFWERNTPEAAREATELAQRSGDIELQSYALGACGAVAFGKGDFESALTWSQRRLNLLDQISDPDHLADIYEIAIPSCCANAQFSKARRLAAEHDAIVEPLSDHHRVHGIAVQLEVEEACGGWNRIVELTERTDAAVKANVATPCIRNARSSHRRRRQDRPREHARRGGSRQRGLGTSVVTPADNQVKASTMYSPPHGYGAKRVLGAVKW